jgi:hypothetical protein
MARFILTVIGSPKPGREDEANDWYDNVHLGEVLSIPGFVSAQRFEPMEPEEGQPVRYLSHYEIEADDPSGPMATLGEAVRTTMNMSDAMDRSTFVSTVYRARANKLEK